MHIEGILLGAVSFLSIGIFHPIVIWAEYHFTCKIWPVFLAAGLICLGISTQLEQVIASAIIGVVGFSCLWSIVELRQQQERVRKGWFPKNPKIQNMGKFRINQLTGTVICDTILTYEI